MAEEMKLTFAQEGHIIGDRVGLDPPSEKEKIVQMTATMRQMRLLAPYLGGGNYAALPTHDDLQRNHDALDWDLVRETNSRCRQATLACRVVPPDFDPSGVERTLDDDLMKVVMRYLSERDIAMLARTSKSMREKVHANQKVWYLAKNDYGFVLDSPIPREIRDHLRSGKGVQRPGSGLVVTGMGEWVEGLTSEETVARTAMFDSDFLFTRLGYGRYHLCSAALQVNCGEPVRRPADNQPPAGPYCQKIFHGTAASVRTFDAYDGKKTSPYLRQFGAIRPLLISLDYYGNTLRQLILHNVPFLNEELTAVIVENLPKLEELSIQSCELLHFGTVLRLLDIVYWTGRRRTQGEKYIEFGIFPKAWVGPVEYRQATAILSHGPLKGLDSQRAVMSTVVSIAMKTSHMGIGLLEPDSLLCQFLELVPMPLGLMPVFLTAIRNYASLCSVLANASDELKEDEKGMVKLKREINMARLEVFGAMTTGKREGIATSMCRDDIQHAQKWTCSSCHHVTNRNLFPPEQRSWLDWQRVCYPCVLKNHLDGDDHGYLREKRDITNKLFDRTLLPLEEDYDVPLLGSIIAATVPNSLVTSPPPHSPGRANHWLRSFASQNVSKLHNWDRPWHRAAFKTRALDSKRRFAEIGMWLFLDSEKYRWQPDVSHYRADQRWESIFEDHLRAQIPARSSKHAAFW